MMNPTNRLGKDASNFQNLQFRTTPQVLLLRHAVGHDDFVQRALADPLNSVAAENAVSDEGENFGGAFLFEEFRRASDSIGCIG